MREIRLMSTGGNHRLKYFLEQQNISLEQKDYEKEWLIYYYKENKTDGSGKMSVFTLAEAISSYIWEHDAVWSVKQYLRSKKCYSELEVSRICERTMEIAYNLKEGADLVYTALIDYLREHTVIIIEGFWRFRLHELRLDLEALAELCGEELDAKIEYEAFIQMLKSYVEIQSPAMDEVHFTADEYGKHHLYTKDGADVSLRCLEEFSDENIIADVNYDDLMVSSLISIAPRKIILHHAERSRNPQLVETVKGIFAGRVILQPLD